MTLPMRYAVHPWLEGWAVIDLVTDRIVIKYLTHDQAAQACDVWNGAAR